MKLSLNVFGYTFNAKHLLVFGIIYVIIMSTTLCGCVDMNTMIFTEGFEQEGKKRSTNHFEQNKYINSQMHDFLKESTEDPIPSFSKTSLLIE